MARQPIFSEPSASSAVIGFNGYDFEQYSIAALSTYLGVSLGVDAFNDILMQPSKTYEAGQTLYALGRFWVNSEIANAPNPLTEAGIIAAGFELFSTPYTMIAGQTVPAATTLRAGKNFWFNEDAATAPDDLNDDAALAAAGFIRIDGKDDNYFNSVQDLYDSTETAFTKEVIEAGGLKFRVLSVPEPDYGIVTAGGVRLAPEGDSQPGHYNVFADGVTDDGPSLVNWVFWAKERGLPIEVENGAKYATSEPLWFGFQDTLGGITSYWKNFATFVPLTEGMIVLDFTGISNGPAFVIGNFWIEPNDPDLTPLYGYGITRPKQVDGAAAPIRSSGNATFENIVVRGKYHLACRFVASSESNTYINCRHFQYGDYGFSSLVTDGNWSMNQSYLILTSIVGGEFDPLLPVSNGDGATAKIIRKPVFEEGKVWLRVLLTATEDFAQGDTVTQGGVSGTVSNVPFRVTELTKSPDGVEGGSTSTLITNINVYDNKVGDQNVEPLAFYTGFNDVVYLGGCNFNGGRRPIPGVRAGIAYVHWQNDRTVVAPPAGNQSTASRGLIFGGAYLHFRCFSAITFGDEIAGGGQYEKIVFGDNLSTGTYEAGDDDKLLRVKYVGGAATNCIIENCEIKTDFYVDFTGDLTIGSGVEIRLWRSLSSLGEAGFLYGSTQSARATVYMPSDADIGSIANGKPGTATDQVRLICTDNVLPTVQAEASVSAGSGGLSNVSEGFGLNSSKAGTGDYSFTIPHASDDIWAEVNFSQAPSGGETRSARISRISTTEMRVQTYLGSTLTDMSFRVKITG